MSAPEILVIFLSVALAVFLALAIALTAYLIVIAKKISRIADTAQETAEDLSDVIDDWRRTVAPAAVLRFANEIFDRFAPRRRTSRRDREED